MLRHAGRQVMGALIALGAVLALPALAAVDDLVLISRATGGTAADGDSVNGSISPDGRFVAFESASNLLSDDDDNSVQNVFLRDVVGGTTVLISRAPGIGTSPANRDSTGPSVSGDGTRVVFQSDAANLSSDPNLGFRDQVFLRDLAAGTLTVVSRATGTPGALGDGDATDATISADGRYVAFRSSAQNLSDADLDATSDVFVRDLLTGITTLAGRATGPDGAAADAGIFDPAISADGRRVAFYSDATNLGADANATADVFVRDLVSGTTFLASRAPGPGGAPGNGTSYLPSLSADGRMVAFASAATNLSTADLGTRVDVYVRDLASATTTLVSRAEGPDGALGDGLSYVPSISGDGRQVAFASSAKNLSEADGDVPDDIFVRDLTAATTRLISRAAGPSGLASDASSSVPVISGDGRYVAFQSAADGLSGDDQEGITDIFRRDLLGDPVVAPPAPPQGPVVPAAVPGAVVRCAGVRATIVGTPGRDVIRGTPRRDVIASLGGNDVVRGRRGADLICLGAGDDTGDGGPGPDRILGGAGRDLLVGGLGADRLLGAAGRDVTRGGRGADFCRAESRSAC
jgi:Tol biopolymer transport system component